MSIMMVEFLFTLHPSLFTLHSSLILAALPAVAMAAGTAHPLARKGIYAGALLFKLPAFDKKHLHGKTGKSQPHQHDRYE